MPKAKEYHEDPRTMKLHEVEGRDTDMKLKLELSKMRSDIEARDETILQLKRDVSALQKTVAALVRKLGPKA